jgi:hypothetical protein
VFDAVVKLLAAADRAQLELVKPLLVRHLPSGF